MVRTPPPAYLSLSNLCVGLLLIKDKKKDKEAGKGPLKMSNLERKEELCDLYFFLTKSNSKQRRSIGDDGNRVLLPKSKSQPKPKAFETICS